MITDEIVEFIEEEIAVYRNQAAIASGAEQEQATVIVGAMEALLEKLCNQEFYFRRGENRMKISTFLSNKDCVGKFFTVAPENYDETENDGYYDVYGSWGQILYMLGESVQVTSVDEKKQIVSMHNEQNDEEWENFEISFEQFQRDFGLWPPSEL